MVGSGMCIEVILLPSMVGPAPHSSEKGLRVSQRHHIGLYMPLLDMISCAALQICHFRRENPSSAINVSNIPGASEKCGGLTRII